MRALCLVGGGAKGIIQAGMLKRVSELGLKIDMIFGTSSGSLNAAMYSQGDIDLMIKLWMTIENKDVKRLSICNMIKQKSIYDSSPLAATIGKYIDPAKLAIPTWATVTSTQTNSAQHVRVDKQVDCHKTLLASTSIPIYFPVIGGYVDGGVSDDYCIGAAIADGADEIIVCHPSRPSVLKATNAIGIGEWAYETTMWNNYVHQMANAGLSASAQDKLMPTGRIADDLPLRAISSKPVRIRVCIPDAPVDISVLDFSYKGQSRAKIIDQGYQIAKKLIG